MSDLISRKAAIDAIRASTSKYTGFMEMEMYTDDDAVEAIEALPSAQPETHDKRTESHACDLIDRAEAIDALRTHERKPSKKWFDNQLDIEWNNAIDICCYDIEDLPSAQPEIIHCRDCRHWYTGDGYNHENGAQCALTHMWMSPDDYCSYGRRKVSE